MYALEENFRILRVKLDGRFDGSSVLAVTSAHRADGTTYVAAGMARAFAEAGEETLLIGASELSATAELGIAANARGTVTAHGVVVTSPDLAQLSVLTLGSTAGDARVVRDVDALLSQLREKYARIVVATDPVPRSAAAYEFARKSDGVLLAVRIGRSPLLADRDLMRLLDESNVETIGVVPTRGRRPVERARGAATSLVPVEYDGSSRLATRKVEVAG